MNKDIEPVVFEKHKNQKVRQNFTFDSAKHQQFTPLNVNEFAPASTCYPIFFIKDRATAQFFPIALFGLESGENLFYSPKQWGVTYTPKMLCLEPFSMGLTEVADGEKRGVLYIDSASPILSLKVGERLYNGSKETPFLTGVRQALLETFNEKRASALFIDRLLSERLIKSVKFNMMFAGGRTRLVDGLYVIDAEKVKGLSGETILDFHQKGYLPPIYAMLSSQRNLFDLVRRKQAKARLMSAKPVLSLQVVDA